YRVLECVEQFLVRHRGVQRAQRLNGGGTGDLAVRVAAHAVGDRQQPAAPAGGILVVLADQPAVGPASLADRAVVAGCACPVSGLSGQVTDEERREPPPCGGFRLGLLPVGGQLFRGGHVREGGDEADRGERHAETAQPRHQSGLLKLGGVVEAVAGGRVDL